MRFQLYSYSFLTLLLVLCFLSTPEIYAKGGSSAAKAAAKTASKSSTSKATVRKAKPPKRSISRKSRTVGQKSSLRYRAAKQSAPNKFKTNRQVNAPKFSKVKYSHGAKRFQAQGFKGRARQVAWQANKGVKNYASQARTGIANRYSSAKGKVQGYKSYIRNAPRSITGKYKASRYAKKRALVAKHKQYSAKQAVGQRLTRGQRFSHKQLKARRSITGKFRAKRIGIANKYSKVNKAKAGNYSKFVGKLNSGVKAGKKQALRGKAKVVQLSNRSAKNLAAAKKRIKIPSLAKKNPKPEKLKPQPNVVQPKQSKTAAVKSWIRTNLGKPDKNKESQKNNIANKTQHKPDSNSNFSIVKTKAPPPLLLTYAGKETRDKPGVAFHSGNLPKIGQQDTWLKGTEGNAGKIPHRIAEKLSGKEYRSFNHFRESFWKEVAKDKHLRSQFSSDNQKLMASGKAPFAVKLQQIGKRMKYELDHQKEIQNGGGVYDMNNLIIRTPLNHLYGK